MMESLLSFKTKIEVKIPSDATLPDIIEMLNHMKINFIPDYDDKEFQEWIYTHQSWFKNGEE